MKRLFYICFLFALVCVMSNNVMAKDVVITNSAKRAIKNETSAEKKFIPLDNELKEQDKSIIHTWVSGSMNLDKATRRKSKIFNRTSYKQSITSDKIRLLDERMKMKEVPGGKKYHYTSQIQKNIIPVKGLKNPVDVLFKEGPGYVQFKKFKEDKSVSPIDNGDLKRMVKAFLKENKIVQENDKDKIKEIYVRERRINEEGKSGEAPDDYVVMQSVVLERQYNGKPVLNSKIEVGVLPDSREVVLFKRYNWTPVAKESARKVKIKKVNADSNSIEDDIEKRIKKKIKKVSGLFNKAEVKEAIPAWFQTEDGLIPVLAISVDIEYPSPKGLLSRKYLEVINLTGDDKVFFKDKGVQMPSDVQ